LPLKSVEKRKSTGISSEISYPEFLQS